MGFNLVDWGKVSEGLLCHELSLEHARQAGDERREIWTLGMGGWGQLAAGRLDLAGGWLSTCLCLIEKRRWIAFRPWAIALLSETQLRQQADPEGLRGRLEEAFAFSCQIADPCWEGAAARALALTYAATDDLDQADSWLWEARRRCRRETDGYVALWVQILADHAAIALRQGNNQQAETVARELLAAAARAHMDTHLRQGEKIIAACAR
jgi:hypothetical protein